MFSKWSLCLPKDTLHWLYQITLNMIWCKIIQIWNVDEHHVKFESLTISTYSQYLQIQTECLQYWSVLWLFLQSLSITKLSATLFSYWRYKKFFTGLFVCLFVCLFLRWYHKMLLSFSPLKLIQSASLLNMCCSCLLPGGIQMLGVQSGLPEARTLCQTRWSIWWFFVFDLNHNFLAS